MKPTNTLFSHCLAYKPDLSPPALRKNLLHSQSHGYTGMVIVPALIPKTILPNEIVRVFKDVGMQGMVCGFNPGGDGNPDPLAGNPQEVEACYQELRRQAAFAAELRDNECGPALMVGPMHTKHRQKRHLTDKDPSMQSVLQKQFKDSLNHWFDKINEGLPMEFDITLAFEALNRIEDDTPEPFATLATAATDFENLFLHVDSGHADKHNLGIEFFLEHAHLIKYLELANRGRNPLRESRGIDFMSIINRLMPKLNEGTLVGVEPFSLEVIEAFDLRELCDTTTPGPKCLELDMEWCQTFGVFVR